MPSGFRTILIILLLLSPLGRAQVISGTITDAATGKPMDKVSVYFDATFKGTVTDSTGKFTLDNKIKTSSPLVVSFIGYESQRISNYTDAGLNIALKPKVIELEEVSVGGDEISRAKAMNIFLKEFIGDDNKNCVIDNPDEIYFRYNKKKEELRADADKPLIISNKLLGYKITFFLSFFTTTPSQTTYKGNYFFTEDIAGLKPAKIKRIIKARDEAYYGSRMHFIRALWANELAKNNFAVYRTPRGRIGNSNTYNLQPTNSVTFDDMVLSTDTKKYIMLAKGHDANKNTLSSNEVVITYKNRNDSLLMQENGNLGVVIDQNGFYDQGLEWKGNISVYRVSMLLPFEFMPEK